MAQRPTEISVLHALTFVYSVCAGIDGEAHPNEIIMATQKLMEWVPDNPGAVSEVANQTTKWISSCSGHDELFNEAQECLNWLRDLPIENRRAIVEDIKSIALSDGKVLDIEEKIFNAVINDLSV